MAAFCYRNLELDVIVPVKPWLYLCYKVNSCFDQGELNVVKKHLQSAISSMEAPETCSFQWSVAFSLFLLLQCQLLYSAVVGAAK